MPLKKRFFIVLINEMNVVTMLRFLLCYISYKARFLYISYDATFLTMIRFFENSRQVQLYAKSL